MILKTNRLILRRWQETDVNSLFEYAQDPDVGPSAGWPAHKDMKESADVIAHVFCGRECYAICEKDTNIAIGAVELKLNGHTDMTTIWCGYYDGNDKSKRVQEKTGFIYHHTCHEVPVPLLNETRIGHTNYMTKEQWESINLKH